MVKPDIAITNRHVVFPPAPAKQLAHREAGSQTVARFDESCEVTIDFAFDGSGRNVRYATTAIPFVTADADPVDAALIRIVRAPPSFEPSPIPLSLAATPFADRYLYVVGHPGKMEGNQLPEEAEAVFGIPDGRKRVSLGEIMTADAKWPNDIVHDASTIGGYSGGCVLGFASRDVVALHYHGTFIDGNRAISAQAIRVHAVGRLL
jgi:hypothetical protein